MRPVRRGEAVRLGLLAEDRPAPAPPPPPGFNDDLEADVPDADGAVLQALREAFGDQIRAEGGRIRWQGSLMREAAAGRTGPVFLGAPARSIGARLPARLDPAAVERGPGVRDADFELLPSLLRAPDRVRPGEGGAVWASLDILDGSVLEASVDPATGAVGAILRTPSPTQE